MELAEAVVSFYLPPRKWRGAHRAGFNRGKWLCRNGFNASGVASGDVRAWVDNQFQQQRVSFSVGQSASVTSNLTVGGTNTAGYFIGNGGGLTNIPTSGVTNFLGT